MPPVSLARPTFSLALPERDIDALVASLILPFQEGRLAWPSAGRVLVLNAREAAALRATRGVEMVCQQDFRPFVDALLEAGFRVGDPGPQERFERVLVMPHRQRDQSRASFAEAVGRLSPGGVVVGVAANDQGARSAQLDLASLAGPLGSLSKHRCRVFWSAPLQAPVDASLRMQWLEAAAPRPILGGRFLSRPGLFAWDRIDPASALLAEHIDPDWRGHAADLGGGWGFLSTQLLERCPGIRALDLFEAQAQALPLARHNLEPHAQRVALGLHWHDVTRGLPGRYDVIVTNPPFHEQARADDPALGQAFIAAAAGAMAPGGRLLLVANRHLPYEAVLRGRFGEVTVLAQRDGFKLFRASRVRQG